MALMRLAALAVLCCALGANAQTGTAAAIDSFVEAEMRRQRIPGVALAVVRDAQMIVERGYGLANIEHRVAVKPDTVFQSGSIGKQFTAAAVLMLAEDGKLSLDDPLTKFLPDTPASWNGISVRHLLNHTSGMADYPDSFELRRDHSEDELLAMIKTAPLAFAPGERWSYSNLGYVTLGILIRKLSGEFYGDVLRKRIFDPLGMGTARVISESDIVPNRAAGYRLVRGALANHEWVAPSVNTTADGSLYLTVVDMAKWDAALNGASLLAPASLERMWAPARLNDGRTHPYGFGWHTGRVHGHRVAFHGGAWQGFQSFVVRFLDRRLTIVVFSNLRQAHASRLARGIAAVFHPEFALPAAVPIEDKEPRVTALLKRALRQLADGVAQPDMFASDIRPAFFPDQAKRLGEQLGRLSLPVAVISFAELLERRDEAGLRVYRYLLTDLGATLYCTLSLTSDDKVAGLVLSSTP